MTMVLRVKRTALSRVAGLLITLALYVTFIGVEISLDSITRTNLAQSGYFFFASWVRILMGELIPTVIAYYANDPIVLQYTLVLLSIIAFYGAWLINPLWLALFYLTPMGTLLLMNIQPFFIATSLFYWGVRLVENNHKKGGLVLVLLSVLFHWAILLLIAIEFFIIFWRFRGRPIVLLIGVAAFFLLQESGVLRLLSNKFEVYSTSVSGNVLHAYLAILMAVLASILAVIKVRPRNLYFRLILLAVIISALVLGGQIKIASRIAFVSDILFFVLFVELFNSTIRWLLSAQRRAVPHSG